MKYIDPKNVELIPMLDGFNCDKCLFFKEQSCECNATHRFLYGEILVDDCYDGKQIFKLKQ